MMPALWIYLLATNITAFTLMAADKVQSRKSGRRIRERTLLLVAAAGGALGAWIAMRTQRHKTKHAAFVIGIPLLLILHAILLTYLLKR